MGGKEEPEIDSPVLVRRRTSGKSPRALFSPAEKLKLVKIIKGLLIKKAGIKSSDEDLNVTLFCRKYLSNHPLLSHASSVFQTKMTNIARSFLSPDTASAFKDFENLINADCGRMVVWPLLEKRAFVPLTAFGKVTALRAMADRQRMKIRKKAAGDIKSPSSDLSASEQVSFAKMTDLEWSAEEKNLFLDHIEKLTDEVLRIIEAHKINSKWLYEGVLKANTHSARDGFAGFLSAVCHPLPFFGGPHFKQTRRESMSSTFRVVTAFVTIIAEREKGTRDDANQEKSSGKNLPKDSNGSNVPKGKEKEPSANPVLQKNTTIVTTTEPIDSNPKKISNWQQDFQLRRTQRCVKRTMGTSNQPDKSKDNNQPAKSAQQTNNNNTLKPNQFNDSSSNNAPNGQPHGKPNTQPNKDVQQTNHDAAANANKTSLPNKEPSTVPMNSKIGPRPVPAKDQPDNERENRDGNVKPKEGNPLLRHGETTKKANDSGDVSKDSKIVQKSPATQVKETNNLNESSKDHIGLDEKLKESNQANGTVVHGQRVNPNISKEVVDKITGPTLSVNMRQQTAAKPVVNSVSGQADSHKSNTNNMSKTTNDNQVNGEQAEQVTEKASQPTSGGPTLPNGKQHQETSSPQSNAVEGTSNMKRRLRSSTRAQATGITSNTSIDAPAMDAPAVDAPAVATGSAPVSRKRTLIAFCQSGRERAQSLSNMSDADHPFKKKRINYKAPQNISGQQQRLGIRRTMSPLANILSSSVGDTQLPRASRSSDMERENGMHDGWVLNYIDKEPTREDSTIANARRVKLYLDMYRRHEQNNIPNAGTFVASIDRVNAWMPAAVMSSPIARTMISKESMDTIKTHLSRVAARAFDPTSLFQSQQVAAMATRGFYAVRRSELQLQGFTRLDGILKTSMRIGLKQRVDKLFQFVDCEFSAKLGNLTKSGNVDVNSGWSLFPNNTTSDKGFYQTQPGRLEDSMPEDTILGKSFVDSCMGRILEQILPEEGDVPVLMFPNHGSTFIRMKEWEYPDCGKVLACTNFQSPDCLEGLMEYHTPPPLYNVFMMFSGRQPFVMRVWPGSHISMNVKKCVQTEKLKTLNSKLVTVPPYSVFIARGDLVHAVATTEETRMILKGNYEKKELGVERMEWMNRGFDDGYSIRGYIRATRGSHVSQQISPLMDEIEANDHNMSKEL